MSTDVWKLPAQLETQVSYDREGMVWIQQRNQSGDVDLVAIHHAHISELIQALADAQGKAVSDVMCREAVVTGREAVELDRAITSILSSAKASR